MSKKSRIVYSLNVEDVQKVATQVYGRELTETELTVVESHLVDYIDWYEMIDNTILYHLELMKMDDQEDYSTKDDNI